nr:hypothetical protein BDOA9_0119670 [Bradyrhizobium sp. DOA9]
MLFPYAPAQSNSASMSSCEAWPTSPASLGPLRSFSSSLRLSTGAGTWDLIASTPPQISIIALMCCSMNFMVVMTLLMRWPVRSWKLQASKIEMTRSWMSSARRFCWSTESTLDIALAAWSIDSAASRICWVACSVPPTTAPSSPLTLAISPPSKLLPCSVAISRLVRSMASWMRSSSTFSFSHCSICAR